MNTPSFTINDLLERIIPGSFFCTVLAIIFRNHWTHAFLNEYKVLALYGLLILFYIIGVLINIIASTIGQFDQRYYRTTDYLKDQNNADKNKKFNDAYKDCFGLEHDAKSWQLCYGVVISKGYAIKTHIFGSLYILCGSMGVACSLLLFFVLISVLNQSINCIEFAISIVSLSILGYCFFWGEAKYSHAFSESIYDSFLTWWLVEGKHPPSQPD